MKKVSMLEKYIVAGLGVLTLGLAGCSISAIKTPAQSRIAAEQTAYYTCDGCHGPKNRRVEFMTPKIIGQKQAYLAAKLRDFRDQKRISPYMNGVVAKLTDQEIVDLADYYANYQKAEH
jgi:cytochrome c553